MICKFLKKIRYSLSYEAGIERRRKELEAYLSQAYDRQHLEYLMRQWDRKHFGGI